MDATQTAPFLYTKRGPVAYMTFNRPEKINCMNGDVYRLLEQSIDDYATDAELRCAIISGAGGNFSSGGDLNWFRAQRQAARDAGRVWQYDFPSYKAMARLKKPVIAAIDGYCLASGFNCAVYFCDIRVATERAKFGSPAVTRGLSDAGNTEVYAMPITWYTGLGNALYMMLTGKHLSADEALRMGLVNEVVSTEALMARAGELAELICQASPRIVQAQKELLRRSQEVPAGFYNPLRTLIMSQLGDQDYYEGTGAFLEKRKPEWNNR